MAQYWVNPILLARQIHVSVGKDAHFLQLLVGINTHILFALLLLHDGGDDDDDDDVVVVVVVVVAACCRCFQQSLGQNKTPPAPPRSSDGDETEPPSDGDDATEPPSEKRGAPAVSWENHGNTGVAINGDPQNG